MLITQRPHGTVMVLHLVGKLEGGSDPGMFLRRIDKLIEDGYRQLVLSFKGVRFISSIGVGILFKARARFTEQGGKIVLCNLNERNISVVYVMRLNEIFTISKNINTALSLFAAERRAAAAKA